MQTQTWLRPALSAVGLMLAGSLLSACPESSSRDGLGNDRGSAVDEDRDGGAASSDDEQDASQPSARPDGGHKPGKPPAAPGDRACGSRGLKPCADDEFCDFPSKAHCGETDAPGVCRTRPDACTAQYDPVCGCDGQTHGNACSAANAGVSVAKAGECDTQTRACGGLRGAACKDGEYCNYPPDALCGAADATGVCEAKPDVCTKEYQPVCGCDDKTYSNACTAAVAGVSVIHSGACDDGNGQSGKSCAGLQGGSCGDDEYCDFAPDALCGRADATGTCKPKPDACTLDYTPVCGCDGTTYGNACAAHGAGVSVETQGECGTASGDAVCGGFAGVSCPSGQYCDYAAGDGCDIADGQGRCREQRQACTREYNPVCGCDGVTYSNACTAGAAGASIRSQGKCP